MSVTVVLTGAQAQLAAQVLDSLGGVTMPGRLGVARGLTLQAIRPVARAVAEALTEKMAEHGGDARGIDPTSPGYENFMADPEVEAVLTDLHEVVIPKLMRATDAERVEAPADVWAALLDLYLLDPTDD